MARAQDAGLSHRLTKSAGAAGRPGSGPAPLGGGAHGGHWGQPAGGHKAACLQDRAGLRLAPERPAKALGLEFRPRSIVPAPSRSSRASVSRRRPASAGSGGVLT